MWVSFYFDADCNIRYRIDTYIFMTSEENVCLIWFK